MPRRIVTAGLFVAMASVVGCSTPNSALTVPITEDYVSPPDEPRYNQPPESGYKAPQPKRIWGSQPQGGGGSMSMGGMQ